MATGEGFIHNVGEPADAFFFEWLDNGCTPSCGGCSGVAPADPPMPPLLVGSEVPIIELRRPQRSAEELASRAGLLVVLLQDQEMSVQQRLGLDEWTRRVAREDDIMVTVLPGEPRIQVIYDPPTDHLVVDNLDAREAARPEAWEVPDRARESAELDGAHQVRVQALSQLDSFGHELLGVPRGSTLSMGRRKAGTIVSGRGVGAVTFEVIFSTFGEYDVYPVFGAQLELGVTRHGKLSRVGISAMHATKIAMAEVRRTPVQALHQLEHEVRTNNPRMLRHEVVSTRVGFISPEGPSRAALVSPELTVDYVVVHGQDDPMVSRRYPVRLSLVSDSPSHLREVPDGAVDDPGDPRHEDLEGR